MSAPTTEPPPSTSDSRPLALPALRLIFLASGVAGLGYQVSWLRMFSVGIGHELPSMLAVVSAFLAGLALGSLLLDRRVSKSARPGAWYAGLELLIGLWALVSIFTLPLLNDATARWIGVDPGPLRHWGLAFALPFFALLPATVAMGGTFPAMERLAARLSGTGRNVAGLYSINTAGALLGTLAITYLALPALGSSATLAALAAVNLFCAAATWLGPARGEDALKDGAFEFEEPPSRRSLSTLVFLCGLLGIGFEVLVVRSMGQVLENTVYSFASGLSLYLAGTAIGAGVYQRFLRCEAYRPRFVQLVTVTAISVAATLMILPQAKPIYAQLRASLGPGQAGGVLAEMGLAAVVFLIPAACMGALFSHLVQAARTEEGGIGRAMACNLAGGALAPIVFGLVLLPEFGAKVGLLLVTFGYLSLLPRAKLERMGLLAAGTLLLYFATPSLRLVVAPPGGRVIAYEEGVLAAVAVVEDAAGNRAIKVNDRFTMGGSGRGFAEWRQAHLPLLLHPAPTSALFLGVGAGATARAATIHPDLAVTAVELVPEVVELLDLLDTAPPPSLVRSEVTYTLADARRFVRACPDLYDVIVADLYQPARDGSGSLYTVEHFRAISERLAAGGLFVQWLPLYQMDTETLRLILRSFLDVYPQGFASMAHFNLGTPILGLFSAPPQTYPSGWFETRVTDERLRVGLKRAAIDDDLDLFGSFIAGTEELRTFAGSGPLNTDDHPRAVFQAPRFTYDKRNDLHSRMVELLEDTDGDPSMLLEPDETFLSSLTAYQRARDRFLGSGLSALRGDVQGRVDGLLESLRASNDFEPAFATAIELSLSPQLTDETAMNLLRDLELLRPEDPRPALARAQR